MSFTRINFAPGHRLKRRTYYSINELTRNYGEGEEMCSESKSQGYGLIWYFQNNDTKETFSVYTRHGMLLIGGITDPDNFERWLFSN